MSIPVRLIVPAHRISDIQAEHCRSWCAATLRAGVIDSREDGVHVLLFDDWEDAALFQREWLQSDPDAAG